MAMLTPPNPRFKPMMPDPAQPQQVLREAPQAQTVNGRTPQQIAKERAIAEAMISQGMDFSPVQHWTQGAARLANQLVGTFDERRLAKEEEAGRAGFRTKLEGYQKSLGDPAASSADRIAQELALIDDPWASEGARGLVNAQMAARQPQPKTDDMREYDWAVQNGFKGSPMEYLKTLKTPVMQAPQGYQFAPGSTPESPRQTFVPGGPADPAAKPPTEEQAKTLSFIHRMSGAEQMINDPSMVKGLQDSWSMTARDILPEGMANFVVSKENQQAFVPAREWLAAALRKDTGAAVTPQEFALYGPMYIPMPGDQPETLATKKDARSRFAEGLRQGLGPLEALAKERELQSGGQQPSAPAAAQFAPPDALPPSDVPGAPKMVRTQQEFDALPRGAMYMEDDGQVYRKP